MTTSDSTAPLDGVTFTDTCPHGVPIRWPEGCIECELEDVDTADMYDVNGEPMP